jgi:alanyl-tRNA synthetase
MKGSELRHHFLNYFSKLDHPIVPSSPIIPKGDASLLFTSAGMVQFKPYFLGIKTDLKRATTSQKCFRTTDIDEVGKTIRHLTFFEMLGNFSFGDYFKEEAIVWAWDYLTKELELDPKRLYISIYKGGVAPRDEEAYRIWSKILPDKNHIAELDDDNNFWTMGPTGPCGPCSEVYYDMHTEGDIHQNCAGPGCDCDRYIEIWNQVFTQFDRQEDGKLLPLPKKNIDTGMGLERLALVVENKKSPFETDLFLPLLEHEQKLLKADINSSPENTKAFRIIADHARSCAFLISEGVLPSNEGRGYVLRRLVRRALRYGKLLGATKPFVHSLTGTTAKIFEKVYPEISKNSKLIEQTVLDEENRFLKTLETGERQIAALLEKYPDTIPGEEVFSLYETYGFPYELTAEIAKKQNRKVDEQGFLKAKESAQETAKANWKDSGEENSMLFKKIENAIEPSEFVGYENLVCKTMVTATLDENKKAVDSLNPGEDGYVMVKKTPFYPESGGQVGDKGEILSADGKKLAEVTDTTKPTEKIIAHKVSAKNSIYAGMQVVMSVSKDTRLASACNHSATHILNAALKKVLGNSLRQAGSFVGPEYFRFDYTHSSAPTPEELEEVENIVNETIGKNLKVSPSIRPLAQAEKLGATMLLGEKYRDPARLVLINEYGWENPLEKYSLELCGGTHTDNTGILAVFKIIKDSALSAGIRRIEGVSGQAALKYLKKTATLSENLAKKLAVNLSELEPRVEQILTSEKKLKREVEKLNDKIMSGNAKAESNKVEISNGVSLVWNKLENANPGSLRGFCDKLKEENPDSVILVASENGEKLSLVIGLSKTLVDKGFDAGQIARELAQKIDGKAGGRKDFAQGGGKTPANWEDFIGDALTTIKSYQK